MSLVRLSGALLLVLLGASACAGGRIEGGVFYSAKGYRVTLPPAPWRASLDSQADLLLTRAESGGGILAHATCEGDRSRRSLPVLARHLTFGLEARRSLERETLTVAGRSGIRVLLEGRLDGAPVVVEAFVLKGQECVYDLIYASPPAAFAAGREAFRRFVESFAAP